MLHKHYGMDIPFPSGALGAKYGVTKDNYGDPMIVILCEFADADAIDAAVEAYAITAVNEGYNVVSVDYDNGHPAYDCSIPYNDSMTMHIQCLYGGMDTDDDGEAEDYLGLFVTSEASVDPYVWPAGLIEYVLGFEANVPALEGEYITYSSSEIHDDDFGNYVNIVVYGATETDFTNYQNDLKSAGYTVKFFEDEDYRYYLAWLDETFFIQLNTGTENSRYYIDINIAKGNVRDSFDI